MKNTSSHKYVDLFCSVFKKLMQYSPILNPSYITKGKIFFHDIILTTMKLIDFLLQGILTIMFAF